MTDQEFGRYIKDTMEQLLAMEPETILAKSIWDEAENYKAKQSANGKKGAEIKRNQAVLKRCLSGASSAALAVDIAPHKPETETETIQNNINTESKQKYNACEDAGFSSMFADADFSEAWELWFQSRKEAKKKPTETVQRLTLQKLLKYPLSLATKALKTSAECGWQGVFPESVKMARNGFSVNALNAGTRKLEYEERIEL